MSSSSTNDPGLVPSPQNLPTPEAGQNVNIRPGSALAVLGVFVEVIRKRFLPPLEIPFIYRWDPDIKKTNIAIESAFNEDKAHMNKRPAIFVDRDEQVTGRSVVGDLAGHTLTTGKKTFWALQTVPILIECVAAKKAESAIIADITSVFLHASSDLIQAKFAFHEMTPVTCGRTQPYPRDKDQWVTPVSFSVQYDLRWSNKPTAALLQQISMDVSASNFQNATDYFETLALYGTTSDAE